MPKKSFAAIKQQIQRLEQAANEIMRKEAKEVVERIRVAIDTYGLKHEDLFGKRGPGRPSKTTRKTPAGKAGRKTRPRAGKKVAIKYRDTSGNTWTGRGSQPRWLVAAVKEGKKLDDFLVKR